MTIKPRFELTVPTDLWLAVATSLTPAFADSYLFGARLSSRSLHPRTLTAWAALKERASHLLASLSIDLDKPPAFQDSGQPSVSDSPPLPYR
jgi:3-deoxy-D-manno-octulosonic-acid transferase